MTEHQGAFAAVAEVESPLLGEVVAEAARIKAEAERKAEAKRRAEAFRRAQCDCTADRSTFMMRG